MAEIRTKKKDNRQQVVYRYKILVETVSTDTNSIWFKNIIARTVRVKIAKGILKPVILDFSWVTQCKLVS